MKQKDISLLLQKADELRALFVLGQRVIPFLEEIFIFVSEIQPLLDEINASIQENLKKMPSASKQLSKVTEATEMAITEVMDIVDGIQYKVEIIKKNYNRIIEIVQKKRENPIALLEALYKAIENGEDLKQHLPALATIITTMKKIPNAEIDKISYETEELISSITNDSNSIMISLQVQDITAQQIAAVNNLLETIQGKLTKILHHFNESEISELMHKEPSPDDKMQVSQLHRKIAFDPEAVEAMANKEFRQQQVDEVIEQVESGNLDEPIDMDEIEKMFANQNPSTEATGDTKSPVVEDNTEEDSFEQFSQDDIDALFGK